MNKNENQNLGEARASNDCAADMYARTSGLLVVSRFEFARKYIRVILIRRRRIKIDQSGFEPVAVISAVYYVRAADRAVKIIF